MDDSNGRDAAHQPRQGILLQEGDHHLVHLFQVLDMRYII